MQIEDFLTKHVEGYLFCDLENMAKIDLGPSEKYGAAGYPMVAAVLSGMELLGGILSSAPFDQSKGNDYFNDYWENYLSKCCPRCKVKNLAPLVRNLVRHGLAHTFLAKVGILVTKGDPTNHLRIDTKRQELWIDAIEFYQDFKQSYFNLVRPIVFGKPTNTLTTKTDMQNRLDEMIAAYSNDSMEFFGKIPPQAITRTVYSGASTSFTSRVPPSGTGFTP
jgi:hypothetical protein